jgi:hypothetical protein
MWMCKLCMFSYSAGVLQMRAVERAEKHFNGADGASSGEAHSNHPADLRDEFFALDSVARLLHSEITSQPAMQPLSRSRCLRACLDAASQLS